MSSSSAAPKISVPPSNVTAYLNDRVELKCRVDRSKTSGGPATKVSWYSRDAGPMPRVGHNYRVHKNGSLVFRFVAKRNEGWYRCGARAATGAETKTDFVRLTVEGMCIHFFATYAGIACTYCVNQAKVISTCASLFLAKVQIVEHPDVIHKERGAQMDLQCAATGDPPPLISWMKGGSPVSGTTAREIPRCD